MCGARECVTTLRSTVIAWRHFGFLLRARRPVRPAAGSWVWCTRRWGNKVLNVTKSRVKTRLPGQILENGPGYLVFRTKRGQVTWICKEPWTREITPPLSVGRSLLVLHVHRAYVHGAPAIHRARTRDSAATTTTIAKRARLVFKLMLVGVPFTPRPSRRPPRPLPAGPYRFSHRITPFSA